MGKIRAKQARKRRAAGRMSNKELAKEFGGTASMYAMKNPSKRAATVRSMRKMKAKMKAKKSR